MKVGGQPVGAGVGFLLLCVYLGGRGGICSYPTPRPANPPHAPCRPGATHLIPAATPRRRPRQPRLPPPPPTPGPCSTHPPLSSVPRRPPAHPRRRLPWLHPHQHPNTSDPQLLSPLSPPHPGHPGGLQPIPGTTFPEGIPTSSPARCYPSPHALLSAHATQAASSPYPAQPSRAAPSSAAAPAF